MNNSKFNMGPLQTEWIRSLREHPERQMSSALGKIINEETGEYRACCLGELHLCYHRMNNLPLPLHGKDIIDLYDGDEEEIAFHSDIFEDLSSSWQAYGLKSQMGAIDVYARPNCSITSLAQMNDDGDWTWSDIADFIEEFPEAVFSESV